MEKRCSANILVVSINYYNSPRVILEMWWSHTTWFL